MQPIKENTSFLTVLRTLVIFATNKVNFNTVLKWKLNKPLFVANDRIKLDVKKSTNFSHQIILKIHSSSKNTIISDRGKKSQSSIPI